MIKQDFNEFFLSVSEYAYLSMDISLPTSKISLSENKMKYITINQFRTPSFILFTCEMSPFSHIIFTYKPKDLVDLKWLLSFVVIICLVLCAHFHIASDHLLKTLFDWDIKIFLISQANTRVIFLFGWNS